MSQQIDLYREDLDVRREWPAHWRLLALFAVSLLLGALLWSEEFMATRGLEAQLSTAEAENRQARERLEELQALHDTPEVARAEATAERAERRRDRLVEAESLLQTRLDRAHESAPASPLTTLARAATRPQSSGIWIRRLHLDGDTGDLTIEGRALQAEALPAYLDLLDEQGLGARRGAPEIELHGGEDSLGFVYRLPGGSR